MKRIFSRYLMILVSMTSFLHAFKYNPPAGGDFFYALTTPSLLADGFSVTGGAIQNLTPSAILANPAVTAGEQRVVVDFSYTAIPTFGCESSYGQAISLGMIIPTKRGVFTADMAGVFSDFNAINTGNNFVIRGGFANDIFEKLYVGANIDFGMGTNNLKQFDWTLNANIGMMYNVGTLGFMKDFRWGVSLTGMGKPFIRSGKGIFGYHEKLSYPALFTLRTGLAGTLLDIKNFKMGASFDLAFPTFQNLIVDVGLGFVICDIVTIKSSWNANVRELMEGYKNIYPSVGVSAKFMIDTSKASFLAKQGWQQSEIVPKITYKSFDDGVTAFSGGATVYFGLRDNQAPEIILWEE
ncbi:MAG: hypothetical protein ACRC4W_01550 [Treponemataceae bacterium]